MTSTEGNESHEPSGGLLAGGHPLPSLRPHKNRDCISRRTVMDEHPRPASPKTGETGRATHAKFVGILAGAKFGSFTNSYRYLLSIQRTTIRIAQLDIVVTGSKREFLGLLDLICKAAIDVDRGILAIRLDLDVSKIRGHVVGLRTDTGRRKMGRKLELAQPPPHAAVLAVVPLARVVESAPVLAFAQLPSSLQAIPLAPRT